MEFLHFIENKNIPFITEGPLVYALAVVKRKILEIFKTFLWWVQLYK